MVLTIVPVQSKADLKAFIELPYRLYADNPNWVPPLKSETRELLNAAKNPWFKHGRAQLFLAKEGAQAVGRISAHIDKLALAQPLEQGLGPGRGFWGFLEAADKNVTQALLATAEDWLRTGGMAYAMGPFSLSYWDEIGLLVEGHDHPPIVMLPYTSADYPTWVEQAGYIGVQDLYTYQLSVRDGFPELVNRIVAMGERNSRIKLRHVNMRRWPEEVRLMLGILNEAWSGNWGFVPFTEAEIAYATKKLKPLVYEHLVRIAEVDGKPSAFMAVIPNVNEELIKMNGDLLPFNWLKLLLWTRKPKSDFMRVPLMGVAKELHGTKLASQLAMMLIEHIRRDAIPLHDVQFGDFGWVVESNGPMRSVGEAVGGKVNKTYRIYKKKL